MKNKFKKTFSINKRKPPLGSITPLRKILLFACFLLANISISFAQLTLEIQDVEACANTIEVPIIVQEATSLTALQFTVQWDGAGLSFDGVTTPLSPSPIYGPNGGSALNDTLTVVWSGADLIGQTFNAGDVVLILNFTVTGTTGSTYNVEFYEGTNNNYPSPPFASGTNFIPILPLNTVDGSLTVSSNTPTLVGCPTEVSASADAGACTAAVNWTIPTVVDCDNNSSAPVEANGFMPGDVFAVGSNTTITYTTTDGDGNSDSCTFDITVSDDENPTINCPSSNVNVTVVPGTPSTIVNNTLLVPTTDDNCPGETVSFSMVNGANTASGSGNADGQEFFLGTTVVTYTVTDASNNSTECTFNVVVEESTAAPLTFEIGNVDAQCCNGIVDVPITVLQDASLTALQFTIDWEGSGLSYNSISSTFFDPLTLGPDSGAPLFDTLTVVWGGSSLSGVPLNAGDVIFTLSFDVTECTLGEELSIDLYNGTHPNYPQLFTTGPNFIPLPVNVTDGTVTTVDLLAPEIFCPVNTSISCEESTDPTNTGTTSATDPCDANPSIIFSDSENLNDCNGTGTITRTWTATDASGNSTNCIQTITVVDNTAPSFTPPVAATINCEDDPTDLTLTGDVSNEDDNCGTNLNATFADNTTGLTGCNGTGTITRTWTLTDDCGQTVSHDQTITVVDNTAPTFTPPAAATINCHDDPTDLTLTGDVTNEDDNCGTNLIAIFTDNTAGLTGCNETGIITRTWTLTDDCGQTVSHDQIITVVDITNPSFTVPADVNLNCGQDATDLILTGDVTDEDDNCGSNLIATYADIPSATILSCGDPEFITRTWTLADACGNIVTQDQIITFINNIACDFTVPEAITINCDQDHNDLLITGDATNEISSCPTTSEATYSDDEIGLTGCNGTGEIIRTWTLDDVCCSSPVVKIQIITKEDNSPPTFNAPSTISLSCGEDVNDLTSTGNISNISDNCDLTPTVDYSDDETGLTGCNNTGDIIRTWTVTDACGNSSSQDQVITLFDNTAATFTAPNAITVSCEIDITNLNNTGNVTGITDDCGQNLSADYSDDNSGLTDCNGTGNIIRTWTVIDDCGNSTALDQIITIIDETNPTFNIPADIVINCNVDYTNTDNTGDASNESDNCSVNIDATYADVLVGTNNCGGPASVIRTWTLIDDCGNSTSEDQIITLVDEIPCEFTVPDPIEISCEDDPDDLNLTGDVLNESSPCNPNPQAIYSDNYNVGCNGTGFIIRIWTLDDGCGCSISKEQIITIVDVTLPTFTVPADISLSCETDITDLSITGDVTDESDNCSADLEATYVDDLDDLTGCNGTGELSRIWTLADHCGNLTTQIQTITLVDDMEPTFTVPADVTINCEDDPTDPDITGNVTDETDNCSANLEATYTDDTSGLTDCNGTGSIIRTWTLVDDCGNTTTQMQSIMVIDDTPPSFTAPADVTLNCNVDTDDLMITGDVTDESDNCSTGLAATFTDVDSGVSGCGGPAQIIRTWTLADDCGNTITADQIITLVDLVLPTFTVPSDFTLNCEDDAIDPTVTGDVTDEMSPCASDPQATYSDDISGLTECNGTGTIIRIWSLDDGCSGVVIDQNQIITIIDETAPSFEAPMAVTINCEDDPTDLSLTGNASGETDNCSTDLNANYTDDNELTECNGTGTILRTWTLEDDCGNTFSQDQIITVVDNTDPTFTVPNDVTLSCGTDQTDLTITGDVTNENDNCSTDLMATFIDVPSSNSSPCGGPAFITRTWTLTDDCGNTVTQEQVITFVNDIFCDFVVPGPENINCEDDQNDLTLTGEVTNITSNCPSSVEITFADDDSGLSGCNNTGEIIRTWTMTGDCCTSPVVKTQIITVEDNTNPTFTVPADASISCEDDPTNLISIGDVTDESDNCSTGLEATYLDDLSGLTECNGTGTIIRTWTLEDDCGNSLSQEQTITVTDLVDPTFTVPSDVTIICTQDPLSLPITGDVTDESDNCSSNLEATFSDIASGSNNCGGPAQILRTWTVTDDCGNTFSQDQLITLTDVGPGPIPPVDLSINCDDDPNDLTITGEIVHNMNPCAADAMTSYSDDLNGLTGCNETGVIVRTWSYDDGCGNEYTFIQNITVIDVTNPTFVAPPAITINCEDDLTDPTATGSPTGISDNCSTSLQATYSDNTAGLTNCNNTGIIIRTWTLTDDCGNAVSAEQLITIVDETGPIANCQNISISLNENGEAFVTATEVNDGSTDNCSGAGSLIFSLSQTEFSCNDIGANSIVFTVEDACGNVSTCNTTITVEDLISPVMDCDVTMDIVADNDPGTCGATGLWILPSASDNCGPPLVTSTHNNNSVFPVGTTTVTNTATDAGGNETTCSYSITVLDTEDPVLDCDPGTFSFTPLDDCQVAVSWNAISATDNCLDGLIMTSTHSPGDTFEYGVSTIVSYLAVDASGNSASCSFEVNPVDVDPPSIMNCPSDTIISAGATNCEAVLNWPEIFAIDNCEGVSVFCTAFSGTSFPLGSTTVTCSATDAAGNIDNCFFTIEVIDDTAPIPTCSNDVQITIDGNIISDPNNILNSITPNSDCSGISVDYTPPTATDACSAMPIIGVNSINPPGSAFPIGSNMVEYTFTDAGGNESSCSFNLEVLPLDAIDIIPLTNTSLCIGEELVLTSNALGTYSWTGPDNSTYTGDTLVLTTEEANAGSFELEVTTTGGCIAQGNINVEVNLLPLSGLNPVSTVCDGVLNLDATAISGDNATWQWSGPCGFNQVQTQNEIITLTGLSDNCSGVYTLVTTSFAGCTATESVDVSIVDIETPNLNLACDTILCITESCFLIGTDYSSTPNDHEYHWSASANAGLPTDTNQSSLEVNPGTTGQFTYEYWVDVEGCISETVSINMTVYDHPEVNDDLEVTTYQTPINNFTVTDNDLIIDDLGQSISVVTLPSNGTLSNAPEGNFTYTPNDDFIGTDFFLYQVCYNCDFNQCDTARVDIRVDFVGDCEVPNIITPNGDGINDALGIICLNTGDYPESELIIFNQWGDKVFGASPYLNDWEGTLDGKEGKGLPDGTYYYIFKSGPDAPADKGYIMIFR